MQVVNCSASVLAIPAQFTTIAAYATVALTFDIFLTDNKAQTSLTCAVGMTDSQVCIL